MTEKKKRGFAVISKEKHREISQKGAKVAHERGTAYRWGSEAAREAGRKGGKACHQKRREREQSPAP